MKLNILETEARRKYLYIQSADATLALSTMDANYTDRLNEKLYNVESSRDIYFALIPCYYIVCDVFCRFMFTFTSLMSVDARLR